MAERSWKYVPRSGTLLSAVLLVSAHPPLELHAFIWVGIVPWLFTLPRCRSWKEAVVQGFWLNFLGGLGGAFWVAYAVPQYLGVSIVFGLVAMVLHAGVHQLHLVAFAPIFRWMSNAEPQPMGVTDLLVASFLYVALDWAVPNLFRDTLGFVLHNYTIISQMAELGGAALLTFVVLIVNLCLFSVAQIVVGSANRSSARRVFAPIALVALVVGAGSALGAHLHRQTNASIASPRERIRVGIVQGNVSGDLKRRSSLGDADAAKEVLTIYVRSSHELLQANNPAELIVWPETAYPGIFRRPENQEQADVNVALDKYIGSSGTPFVFGAYDREDRTEERVLHNAVFFVEPKPGQTIRELSPMQVYHKHILFPVGEYLPFVGEGFLRRWLPNAGDFATGEGPEVYEIRTAAGRRVKIGPSICYEDLFPMHPIALARMGAELIVNVSNDSWFGNYGLPQFHLIAAKLRSIETRLPQVRATNTGYSALILPTGELREPTEYGIRRAVTLSVPVISPSDTLMIRWGDWFGAASLVVSICGLALLRGSRRAASTRGAS